MINKIPAAGIKDLNWLGIKHDGKEYIQSSKIDEHVKIANELLKNGFAYKCYCSPEEIEEQKKRARQKKIPYIYNRKWRGADEKDAPKEIKPVIRFKVMDTRKMTPGLRKFEKYAVYVGGGWNHRLDLSSGILIKDNHLMAAGGIEFAIKQSLSYMIWTI